MSVPDLVVRVNLREVRIRTIEKIPSGILADIPFVRQPAWFQLRMCTKITISAVQRDQYVVSPSTSASLKSSNDAFNFRSLAETMTQAVRDHDIEFQFAQIDGSYVLDAPNHRLVCGPKCSRVLYRDLRNINGKHLSTVRSKECSVLTFAASNIENPEPVKRANQPCQFSHKTPRFLAPKARTRSIPNIVTTVHNVESTSAKFLHHFMDGAAVSLSSGPVVQYGVRFTDHLLDFTFDLLFSNPQKIMDCEFGPVALAIKTIRYVGRCMHVQ